METERARSHGEAGIGVAARGTIHRFSPMSQTHGTQRTLTTTRRHGLKHTRSRLQVQGERMNKNSIHIYISVYP
jgi:hypothetical protein